MSETHTRHRGRRVVAVAASALLLAGVGTAIARTSSGPPWGAEEALTGATDPLVPQTVDPEDGADIGQYFDAFAKRCGADLLGDADLADVVIVDAFGTLIEALDGGQTSHGVQGIRSVLTNCEDHANRGLRNALAHLGQNWLRHHQHELWLREKFEAKWPDGKPGNGNGQPGGPHSHAAPGQAGAQGNGNANGPAHASANSAHGS